MRYKCSDIGSSWPEACENTANKFYYLENPPTNNRICLTYVRVHARCVDHTPHTLVSGWIEISREEYEAAIVMES